uniref:Peptidase S1 domain-containing protein n=1 Tax=Timema bartmani TaxID=61472 RepID=A0A7R9I5C2_9NEOP|nr:unnamed protein product [Timema bartmani]
MALPKGPGMWSPLASLLGKHRQQELLLCWNHRVCQGVAYIPGSGTSRLDPVETCQPINDCISLLLLQAAVLPDWTQLKPANQSMIAAVLSDCQLKPANQSMIAAVLPDWTQLKPVNLYVPEDTVVRSPQEWEEIYARQELRPLTPIEVVGAVPQPAEAGKTSVTHTPDPRIIGGASAARGQFPWQAYLILGGSGLCGGSIISSSWILTAAHCLQGFDTFSVTLGSTSRAVAQVGSHTQVSRLAIIHAQYSGLLIRNDIGLIRLNHDVLFSDVIAPVRLPSWSQSANSFSGYPAIVSGFGLTVGGGSTASATLNYADVAIISNTACSATFPLNLRESNICTSSTNGKSPCNGDSGGPLVILETDGLYTEVGIVSFGTKDCPVGSPAAFTRVTSFLDWISINTGLSIPELGALRGGLRRQGLLRAHIRIEGPETDESTLRCCVRRVVLSADVERRLLGAELFCQLTWSDACWAPSCSVS